LNAKTARSAKKRRRRGVEALESKVYNGDPYLGLAEELKRALADYTNSKAKAKSRSTRKKRWR
jgi:hypothetical protein